MNEFAYSLSKENSSLLAAVAQERGYTLLETVVAMALFAGVLIPLITLISNFMLEETASQMRGALHEARSEISKAVAEGLLTDTTRTTTQGLTVKRVIKRVGRLVGLDVAVSLTRRPDKVILRLHKSVLSY